VGTKGAKAGKKAKQRENENPGAIGFWGKKKNDTAQLKELRQRQISERRWDLPMQ